MSEHILLRGLRENNLKNISLSLEKNTFIVFTGVSGSGKSSIVHDCLAVESQRQWTSAYPAYLRNQMPLYERPDMDGIDQLTPVIVVDQKPFFGGSHSKLSTASGLGPLIRLLFSRVAEPSAGEAAVYKRNHPDGACPACMGSGQLSEIIVDRLIDPEKSLKEGALNFSQFAPSTWQGSIYYLGSGLFDNDKKLKDYSQDEWKMLLEGPEEEYRFEYYFRKTGGSHEEIYEGVLPRFRRLYMDRDLSSQKKELQEEIRSKLDIVCCPHCEGSGYSQKVRSSKIQGKNIVDYAGMQLSDLLNLLRTLVLSPLGEHIKGQILDILERMVNMNLGYLTLNRESASLSGGEAQRLKLVKALNSSLNNITYILDEPSHSLHPQDLRSLLDLIEELRDRSNTLLVVEHDPQIIERADWVVDIGPGAGTDGGEVVFEGDVSALLSSDSPTGGALRKARRLKSKVRPSKSSYPIQGASLHNLKDVSVDLPRGILVAVVGVAGSGKSSLMDWVFPEQHEGVIVVDQRPLQGSSRSTPASYTGVMDIIRQLFADASGEKPGLFSFNSLGACPVCKGRGLLTPDLAFADPVTVVCEACHGSRYSDEAIGHRYKGKSIVEVLAMTVDEALQFFESEVRVERRLEKLSLVGLGYLSLGQATSTLSGGENQRLKLADFLGKKGQAYVFDEPSSGLHINDNEVLLRIFNQLVDDGNSIYLIEHNLQIISQADWVIELGPGAGHEGGEVIFEGTVTDLAEKESSPTGQCLKQYLS